METEMFKPTKWMPVPWVSRKASYDASLGDETPVGYEEGEDFFYPRDYEIVGTLEKSKYPGWPEAIARAKELGWEYTKKFWTARCYVFYRWVG